MAELYGISDGTYTLQETDNKNQFLFYRNDGGVLTDIDHEPLDLYHAYIFQKMVYALRVAQIITLILIHQQIPIIKIFV